MLTVATGLLLPGARRARCVFMVKTALLAAVAGLLISSCGTVETGIGPAPSPSTGPGLGFDAMVTEKDKAITIQRTRG